MTSRSLPLALFMLFVSAAITAAGCGDSVPEAGSGAAEPPLAGVWRAVLSSPGGELPFTLDVTGEEGALRAVIGNGDEEAPLSSVERQGSRVVLRFDWYDSEITAELDDSGGRMAGRWRKTVPDGESTLAFAAARGEERRFLPPPRDEVPPEPAMASVAGHWAVEFRDEDGVSPARGELTQEGDRVTGTFLTPTGDYRFLEGSFEGGLLRLSTFDGAHAFLFHARAADGETRGAGRLEGDFWSRDTYHATWTARRLAAGEEVLPDGWSAVGLTNDEGRFRFRFPDLEGRPVSLAEERFAGKVVLVNIFGSWCPNCNDEAPLLAAWHRRYGGRGLEIVGLAYEFSGDPERDREMVRRFAERHGIDYPLLLAGTSDKAAAAATLPDLTAVLSYPTSVFVGRDGKVRRIYSGFSGPGTGEHHQRLVAELEGLIEELLAEPA
jgi:thiol-disulfide isomerase/thioredoxin